jgi:excisionase family DNA binding protein
MHEEEWLEKKQCDSHNGSLSGNQMKTENLHAEGLPSRPRSLRRRPRTGFGASRRQRRLSARSDGGSRSESGRELSGRREDALSEVLTPMQAADLLGLGRSAMYERIRSGEIPHLRLGRKILISRLVLAQLVSGEQPARAAGDKP